MKEPVPITSDIAVALAVPRTFVPATNETAGPFAGRAETTYEPVITAVQPLAEANV